MPPRSASVLPPNRLAWPYAPATTGMTAAASAPAKMIVRDFMIGPPSGLLRGRGRLRTIERNRQCFLRCLGRREGTGRDRLAELPVRDVHLVAQLQRILAIDRAQAARQAIVG